MLQEKHKSLHTMAYLVAVEMDEGDAGLPELVRMRIAEGLYFIEGVGKVDVDELGLLEEYEKDEDVHTGICE